jgi:hypothetical protein
MRVHGFLLKSDLHSKLQNARVVRIYWMQEGIAGEAA